MSRLSIVLTGHFLQTSLNHLIPNFSDFPKCIQMQSQVRIDRSFLFLETYTVTVSNFIAEKHSVTVTHPLISRHFGCSTIFSTVIFVSPWPNRSASPPRATIAISCVAVEEMAGCSSAEISLWRLQACPRRTLCQLYDRSCNRSSLGCTLRSLRDLPIYRVLVETCTCTFFFSSGTIGFSAQIDSPHIYELILKITLLNFTLNWREITLLQPMLKPATIALKICSYSLLDIFRHILQLHDTGIRAIT